MSDLFNVSDDSLWAQLATASDSQRPEILQQLGWREIQRHNWSEAIVLLEEAKAGFEKVGCSTDIRMCAHWIARCASEIGDLPLAISQHQQVLRELEARGPLDEFGAKTVDAIGCEFRDCGNHAEALSYFSQAARLHDINGDKKYAVNSGRKWIEAIRRTGAWSQMDEAADTVLRNSTDVDDHIHAHIGRIHAACNSTESEVDVDALLAKCHRLTDVSPDEEMLCEIFLAEIAISRSRGQSSYALTVAGAARKYAQSVSNVEYQAQFILAEAELTLGEKPEAAKDLLLIAKDLGEVLKDEEILDRVTTSMMQLREAQLSNPNPTLWEAAEDSQ